MLAERGGRGDGECMVMGSKGETCAGFREDIDPLIRIGDHHVAIKECSIAGNCFS
jgi:hypothetical protein